MIVIIDSCGANFASIYYALQRLDLDVRLSSNIHVIRSASAVILPGVGSAKHAMEKLRRQGLIHVLQNLTQPVLGICLGMQLLFERSKEGEVECLGLIPGEIQKISLENTLPIPHMGWNQFYIQQEDAIFSQLSTGKYYVYFVHSYIATLNQFTLAQSHYGQTFSSVVKINNFYGMQFHPEKSGAMGAQLLKNFASLR